jgi:predicted CXXCH cytochrome family protein
MAIPVNRVRTCASLVLVSLTSIVGAGSAWAQKQPAANDPSSVSWKTLAQGKPEDYVGEQTCAGCHAEQAKQFAKTVHARAHGVGVKYGTSCESCHGPGKAHADAMMEAGNDSAKTVAGRQLIFSFNAKPEENAAHCLACHSTSRDQHLFHRSEHKLQGVSCDQCHASHLLVPPAGGRQTIQAFLSQPQFFSVPKIAEENRWLSESLLKKRQPELCYTCHLTIQAQFALPSHHRVPEGMMKCTDCHNAHGTMNRPLLRKTNWEICVGCHQEKRGPFVFEHAAVKVEGCTICHGPHGTVTRQLLLRREDRFLCLECHVDPFAVNVPHGRLGFQTRGECVRCHTTIHGSNVNEFFLQ